MRNPQLEYQQQSVKNASPLQLVVKMYDLAIQATYSKDENGVMVDINNREVLDAFAGAISETFADEARASIFNVYSNNVQFSIQSLQSESEGAFELSGATGALAGITDPMTKLVPDAANLDVHFTIDGVTFLRSENIVDDAITGLSFTLRGESTENVQISAQRDLDSVRENVDDFMATFNEMNRKIRERSFVDGDNNTRGPQRGFRSIRNLTLNLRQTALLPTDGVEPETLSRLSEIGIAKQERYPEDFEELQREIFNKLQQVISQGDARFQPGMAFRNSTKF